MIGTKRNSALCDHGSSVVVVVVVVVVVAVLRHRLLDVATRGHYLKLSRC